MSFSNGFSPGFCPPLFLYRPQFLAGDGEFGRVDHFGLPAAVRELQRAVPLALGFAHDGVGRIVFDLCSHSEEAKRRRLNIYSIVFDPRQNKLTRLGHKAT